MSEEPVDYKINGGKIYKIIPEIISEIEAVGKDHENKAQGYKFRSVDDILAEIKPRLGKHGVFFSPEVCHVERTEHQTRSGTTMYTTLLTIRFSFYADDGSMVSCSTIGEGADMGDKSANKAMSAGLKYALIQLFCIPTADNKDSEFDNQDKGFKAPKKNTTKSESDTISARYFALLSQNGIVTEEQRHAWQDQMIGKASTKDWVTADFQTAIDILKGNPEKENSHSIDSYLEEIAGCTTMVELSNWFNNNIDTINTFSNKDKQTVMTSYREKVRVFK